MDERQAFEPDASALAAARGAVAAGVPGADALVGLVERDRRRTEELARLVATAKSVSASLDLPVVLSAIVRDATTLLGATSGDMLFWERERDTLRVVAVAGLPADLLGYELAMGEGVSSQAIREGRTLQVEDYATYPNRARALERYRFGSVLCAPVLFRGEAIGALNVHTSDTGHRFAPGDADLLQAFAGLAAIAIDHARRFENEVRLSRELARTNEDLVRTLSLQRRLTDRVLSGGGPSAVASELAAVLDRSVVIEDHLGRAIAGASPDHGDGWRRLASTPSASASAPRRRRGAAATVEPHVTVPVSVGSDLVGRLTFGVHGTPDPVDRALVDIATTGVALEFAKIRAALDVEQRVRGDVIHDLLSGAFADAEQMAARVARLGYVIGDLHDLVVLDVDRPTTDAGGDAAAVELERRIIDRLAEVAAVDAPRSVVATMDRSFVVLATDRREPSLRSPEAFAERLRAAVAAMSPDATVSAAVGDRCDGPADFARSHRLARESLDVMARLGRRGHVVGARALGPYRVLLRATEPDELRAFARGVLQPLLPPAAPSGGDLLETLRVYLDEGSVRRRAADRLFVHVNTVVYRLDRIERLLGRDLDDPRDAFELTLALRILDLADGPDPASVADGRG